MKATPSGCSLDLVPVEKLKPEQQRALEILASQWQHLQSAKDSVEELSSAILTSGYQGFFKGKLTGRNFFREEHWSWNQSHRKVRTAVFGAPVMLQKFTPKKTSSPRQPCDGNTPPFKLWIFSIDLESPYSFVWMERGIVNISSMAHLPMMSSSLPILHHARSDGESWPSQGSTQGTSTSEPALCQKRRVSAPQVEVPILWSAAHPSQPHAAAAGSQSTVSEANIHPVTLNQLEDEVQKWLLSEDQPKELLESLFDL